MISEDSKFDAAIAEAKKATLKAEQNDNIGVSGKGYWLFDRNDYLIFPDEGFRPKVAVPKVVLADIIILIPEASGPWAIYKWIPWHRS